MKNSEILEFAEPDRLVAPAPWVGHIPFVYWLVQKLQPELVVELGTHTGNSYCAICEGITKTGVPARAFAVDTWQGDVHAGLYSEDVYEELSRYHNPRYGHFSTLLRKTFDEAVSHFGDGSIDLLHIDGLHTYEAVKHDFESWKNKISSRGVVLFHDTCVYERNFGVHQLWAELIKDNPGISFTHSNGLGVLLFGPQRHPDLVAIANDPERQIEFRTKFAALGRSLERRAALERLQPENSRLTLAAHELKRQFAEEQQRAGVLQSTVDGMMKSRSWRVTAPMRALLRFFK